MTRLPDHEFGKLVDWWLDGMSLDKKVINIRRYLSYKISPNNLIWAYDSDTELWYCLSPAGEYWEDDGETTYPNSIMSEMDWPEIKFEVNQREWIKKEEE